MTFPTLRTLALVPLLLLPLAACTGDDDEDQDEGEDKPAATLTIDAPTDGATFEEGDAVTLSVSAARGQRAVEVTRATWTIGDWTGQGAATTAQGLAAGSHTVSVEAIVEGDTLTGSVGIEVLEAQDTGDSGDTGDTGSGTETGYTGTMQAVATIDSDDYGTFDDNCNGPINFGVTDSGQVAGTGSCTIFDTDITFRMEGMARNGETRGDMILEYDGQEFATPWVGSGDVGGALTANFSATHRADGGSVTLDGSWTANPR